MNLLQTFKFQSLGIPQDKLSELHGNVFIEVCDTCNHRYERPYYVMDDVASQYFEEMEDFRRETEEFRRKQEPKRSGPGPGPPGPGGPGGGPGMNPVDIQSYEAPWKALSDFALHTDLERLNPNTPQFQHLVNQVLNTFILRIL